MKIKIIAPIIISLLVFLSIDSQAQSQSTSRRAKLEACPNMHQELEALKIAHITSEVGLTPDESEKFWPIYNKYWNQRTECMRSSHEVFRNYRRKNEITENEAREGINCLIRCKKSESEIIENLSNELSRILSQEKILKVFMAENSFKRVVIEKTKNMNPQP